MGLQERLKKVKRTSIKLEGVGELHGIFEYAHSGVTYYYLNPIHLYCNLKGSGGSIGQDALTLEAVHDNLRALLSMDPAAFIHNGYTLVNFDDTLTGIEGTLRKVYHRYKWIDHEGVVQDDDRTLAIHYEIKVSGNSKYPGEVVRYAVFLESAMDCFTFLTTGRTNHELFHEHETEEEFIEAHEGESIEGLAEFYQGQPY
jgi:hypothetical protein